MNTQQNDISKSTKKIHKQYKMHIKKQDQQNLEPTKKMKPQKNIYKNQSKIHAKKINLRNRESAKN